jgi:hypothetical protein
MANPTYPTGIFEAALPLIESKSIREWAQQNRAAWLKIIANRRHMDGLDSDDPARWATVMVIEAMGM